MMSDHPLHDHARPSRIVCVLIIVVVPIIAHHIDCITVYIASFFERDSPTDLCGRCRPPLKIFSDALIRSVGPPHGLLRLAMVQAAPGPGVRALRELRAAPVSRRGAAVCGVLGDVGLKAPKTPLNNRSFKSFKTQAPALKASNSSTQKGPKKNGRSFKSFNPTPKKRNN